MINRIHKEDGSDTVVFTTGSHEDSYLSQRTYVLPRIGEYSFKECNCIWMDFLNKYFSLQYSIWDEYYNLSEGSYAVSKYRHFFNGVFNMANTYAYKLLSENATVKYFGFNR